MLKLASFDWQVISFKETFSRFFVIFVPCLDFFYMLSNISAIEKKEENVCYIDIMKAPVH